MPSDHTSKDYYKFLEERLQIQKVKFLELYSKPNIEKDFSGLYSLLRLGQEPSDEEIEDATNKYLEFIELEYDETNEQHLRNEKYFIKVFESLRHSQNPIILKKLLKVIKFYIYNDKSSCQKDIIKPDTILWMLEIMTNEAKTEIYLRCLTSATVL